MTILNIQTSITYSHTCKNPLKGARPVPGPTIIIGIE